MRLKKLISAFAAFAMAVSVISPSVSALDISAESAVAMDYNTGEILYDKDAGKMMIPASMTKIMTAYIIYEELEAGNITKESQIPVSAEAAEMSRSWLYPKAVPLKAGASYSVDTLLQLIFVPSASASCFVMAEYISGSEEEFVKRMNSEARAMGMKAEFKNSHGAQVHYTTAESIAILVRKFISRFPDVLNYTSLKSVTFNDTTYENSNHLLSWYYYEGADGFKTGTIVASGRCLAATAIRNGRRMITVIMNSESDVTRHTDSIALLDAAFQEAALRDASRASTEVSFDSPTQSVRLNCDFTVNANISEAPVPYYAAIRWRVNGETVKTQENVKIQSGGRISAAMYIDGSEDENVKTELDISQPDGSWKTFEYTLPLSGEAPASFHDIGEHWAINEIETLAEAGVLNGYEDGLFRPDSEMTRSEFITALTRALELHEIGGEIEFSDISGHWAEESIKIAAGNGIISGDNEGRFFPDRTITRQELAVIMANILNLPPAEASLFADGDMIAGWAEQAVNSAAAAGLLSGYADGSLHPQSTATRAECAVIILRILNYRGQPGSLR